jgi:hypothetical protein
MRFSRLRQQVAGDAALAVLRGAALGITTVASGSIWNARGEGRPVGWDELKGQVLIGGGAGAVIALVVHFTRGYRERGRIQHYAAWMLACVIATFVFVMGDIPQQGWTYTILFSLWLGFSAGLAFGIIARQLNGHRW